MSHYEYAVTVKVKNPDEDISLSRVVKGEIDTSEPIGSPALASQVLDEATVTFEDNLKREREQQKLPT